MSNNFDNQKEDQKTSSSSSLSWKKVEKYLAEKTQSGKAMALIETEKIFQQVLEKIDFPGKTVEQKMPGLKLILSNFKEFKEARRVYKKLTTDIDFDFDSINIENILAVYYKAIEEIIKFYKEKASFLKTLQIKLAIYFPQPKTTLKKIGLGLVVFFFIIFVLDSTKWGRGLVFWLVKVSHFIFSWVLFTLLLVAGIIIIIVGSIFYFESRKKKQEKLRIEK